MIKIILANVLLVGCSSSTSPEINSPDLVEKRSTIDLSPWKITLPIDNDADGTADEFVYPYDYSTNEYIKPFLYESLDASLVFYCTYSGISTPNSKYSRTELREQLVPGDNSINWTFDQGGTLSGKVRVSDISQGHRTIIMQIHGRLTDQQKELIGANDYDAPPLLKIYFDGQKIRVARKILVDVNSASLERLVKNAWQDDTPFYFEKVVGDTAFDLKIVAAPGRLEVHLDEESKVYEDFHMDAWPFENYFKAGNYLQSDETGAFAKVQFYSLNVTH